MTAFPGTEASLQPLQDRDELQAQWLELQQRADCSFFQSWGWIENWLHLILPGQAVRVMRLYHQRQLIALGVFTVADSRRRYLIRSRCLTLHESRLPGFNMVVEYNGLLVARGYEIQAYRQLADCFLGEDGHDELVLPAVDKQVKQCLYAANGGNTGVVENARSPCYQTRLDFGNGDFDAYLATLSRNSREQIRRSRRLYAARGELALQTAASCEQALQWFSQMKQLHQSRWQAKGQRGAFGNPHWESFHRRLITQRFDRGEIQMMRLDAAGKSVAFLYNHIWRKRVYVQQMGFRFEADNRIKPGYLAHALAIVENSRLGHRLYDFMHGEARYKRSLGHASESLYWLALQQPRWRFCMERAVVASVRRWRDSGRP